MTIVTKFMRDKEHQKQYAKEYYQKHRAKIIAQNSGKARSYNKEHKKQYDREKYLKNKDKILAQHREWERKHQEETAAYKKKWAKEHPHDRNVIRRRWWMNIKSKIILFFGGSCLRCGFDDPRALQFDHINGDGHLDGHNGRNLAYTWRLVRDNPEAARKKFQLLCANCNWIKRMENKEVPDRGYGKDWEGYGKVLEINEVSYVTAKDRLMREKR